MARQTQHRPRREDGSKSQELRDAKQENKRLKRSLSQARKQVQKLLNQQIEVDPPSPQIDILNDLSTQKCPKCSSADVREFELGAKRYLVCAECRWRKPVI